MCLRLNKCGWFTAVVVAFLLFGLQQPLAAQSTGQIRGKVIDGQTNEPLAGVNVVVVGTQRGAATNADGEYSIINVPVGMQDVRASLVGYAQTTKAEVLVTIDQTSRVNFEMGQETVVGEEVVVTAARDILHKEVSSTQNVITSELMYKAPATRGLQDFIARQAGVSGNLSIRGGSADETGTMINGMSFTNNDLGQPSAAVPLSAVEQVSVTSGGYTAEHGNFRSGLIDITTKTGDANIYSGRLDISKNRPHQKRFGRSLFDPHNYYLRHKLDPAIAFEGTDKALADDPYLKGQTKSFGGWNNKAKELNKNNTFDKPIKPIDLYLWQAWMTGVKPPWDELKAQGYNVSDDLKKRVTNHARPLESTYGDYNIDVGVGGPVPVIGKFLGDATFYLSHQSKQNAYVLPMNMDVPHRTDRTTMLTLRSRLARNLTLTLNGLYGFTEGITEHGNWNGGAYAGILSTNNLNTGIPYRTRSLYNPGFYTPKQRRTSLIGAKIQHTINANTFWNLTLNTQQRKDLAVQPWAKAGVSVEQYESEGWSNRTNCQADGSGKIICSSPVITFGPAPAANQPYGYGSGFTVVNGPDGSWDYGLVGQHPGPKEHRWDAIGLHYFDSTRTRQYNAQFNITSQLSVHHLLKGGLEFNRGGYHKNVQFNNFTIDHENETFIWDKYPIRGGAYLQDQIEYEGIVANLGLRADYYNPGGKWPNLENKQVRYSEEAFGRGGQRENVWKRWEELGVLEEAKSHLAISPRIGLSFPVTARSKFFFNYGHFRSLVPWNRLFRVHYSAVQAGVWDLGNPGLAPPRTISYETGVDYNLLDQYLIRISGYYKDITGEAGRVRYVNFLGTSNFWTYSNNNYEDVLGLELSVTKNVGQWFTGWANFDFMLKKDGLVGRRTYYEDPSKMAVFGLYEGQEARPLPRPSFNANLRFHTPVEWGPKLGSANPLGGWTISLLPSWSAGVYDTWNPLGKLHLRDNIQWPHFQRWDARLSKQVAMGPAEATLYLDVTNLLNQKRTQLYRSVAFAGGGDFRDYMASLHLPMYESAEFDELRENSPEGYYEPGNDNPGDLRSEEKPYINDPNKMLWANSSPRDIWFGITVNF